MIIEGVTVITENKYVQEREINQRKEPRMNSVTETEESGSQIIFKTTDQ